MPGRIDARLAELGIKLPDVGSPVANYAPFTIADNLAFISGQAALWEGEYRYIGQVGKDVSLEDAYQAARICGLNLIAHFRAACEGDLDRVQRVLRLGIFISVTPEFRDHSAVANGATDLLVEVFGDAARPARYICGAPSLPGGAAVAGEALIEIA